MAYECPRRVYGPDKGSLSSVSHSSTSNDRFHLTDYDHLSSNFPNKDSCLEI